ncbi:NAD(P)-dependent oxidoreductase [Sabulicella rubraurantiaca]|uniref:NAD(P)-dependent oxidoreductase n=1 Tax=Sabulicella rubraurantiaca TaxID=2811429 RepID=UPI001A97AD78|nr:NAD(P)-dependent oxidoreductase [Sabulicella rubraurantiaca]
MRLAIINDYHHVAREAADWSRLPGLEVSFHGRVSDAEAPALLADCDMVVTSREETRFDAALLEKLPRLRLLVTHGMNNAALDLPALAARGVTVCGTSYGFTMATVELAWGLILSLVKRIPAEDRAIREGGWGAALGGGLTGRVLGLVGLGTLGGDMARLGRAFGMEVIAWSENLTEDRCTEVGARHVQRHTLFAEADIVSIHTRYSKRTHGLVGAAELGAMRRHALLINTSRGPIVDEAALVTALREGRIGGAGLDVYDTEPLPVSHSLRGLPNTVLTAHVGGRTRENFLVRYRDALETVEAFLAGRPLRVLAGPGSS